jgi:glycerate-2-kinase
MSIILNKEELLESNSELRKNALEILEVGYEAINTEKILRKKISVKDGILGIDGYFLNLKSYERIFFVGIGKCALDGAKVVEDILGDYLSAGAVIDVREVADAEDLMSRGKIKYFQGTHPLPSQQNIEATKEILEMVKGVTEKDLIITLISGGGSALFDLPDEAAMAKLGLPGETSLETVIRITKELTAKGADIYELNAARKEMSQVKGGKFAEICHPVPMVSLIFSDVPGNDISVIASGPTVLDTPDAEVKNILIASNKDALDAMKAKAEKLGFNATIETEKLSGNADEVGKELALREPKPKTCVLFGGETTVKILENHGEGGRNQEMALSALPHIRPDSVSVLVCAASDGWDNTDHAGAIADKELFEKSKNMNLSPEEYLERSDSYNFFRQVGGAISTGRRGSNVSDLVIMLYK